MLRPCWPGLAVAAAMMRKRQPKLDKLDNKLALSTSEVTSSLDIIDMVK